MILRNKMVRMNYQKTTWLQRCFQSAKSIYLTLEALLHFFSIISFSGSVNSIELEASHLSAYEFRGLRRARSLRSEIYRSMSPYVCIMDA